MNRLAHETSPYLQQHKENPVDWYPWGEEAFARARAENRPILLSIGYSACHWCHVMEHESFADEATAAVMNDGFVSIKVDREERPDVDGLYMQAVQQMTGHGGWPMTVFLTPDGAPFYGGTYFPPEPRHGLPSFRQILQGVREAFQDRRSEVDRGAAQLIAALAQGTTVSPEPTEIEGAVLDRAYRRLLARFDDRLGGFGGAPKFPQPMILDFLLLYWLRTGNQEALGMVETTLDAMAAGGMYDQVGGGFHRYSVDAEWLVPHFEKMLYDNALLSVTYLHAYQVTGRLDFRTVTEEVLDYVLREMRSPDGGFYSSQDADSEGVEGRFYVWSADEIDDVLGRENGSVFRRIYGATEAGNWEETNILHRPEALARLAEELGVEVPKLEDVKARGRKLLYEHRSRRAWPARDEKVIASWNAMMTIALAEAGRVLARPDYVGAADACADFILGQMMPDGRLLRSWRDGKAKIDGFLEDYALLTDALLSVYAATFDPRRVEQARSVADRMLELFWDPEQEIFFDTAKDGERLVVRPRDIYDNATPSGTSAAARALIRLGRLTAEPEYERVGSRVLRGMAKVAAELPQGFGVLLSAIAHHLSPPTEVAIVGEPAKADTSALVTVVNRRFLPFTAVTLLDPAAGAEAAEIIPLLADRPMRNGRATAYVCRHYTCKEPVTEPHALDLDLDTIVGGEVRG